MFNQTTVKIFVQAGSESLTLSSLNSSASDDESESDLRWGTTLFLNRLYWSLPLFVISTSSQNQLPST